MIKEKLYKRTHILLLKKPIQIRISNSSLSAILLQVFSKYFKYWQKTIKFDKNVICLWIDLSIFQDFLIFIKVSISHYRFLHVLFSA